MNRRRPRTATRTLVACAVLAWVLEGRVATAQSQAAAPSLEGEATEHDAAHDATTPAAPSPAHARVRARLAREPKPEAVVAAALAHFGQGTGDAHKMARRARRAGWVPRLTGGIRRGQGLDYATRQGDTGGLSQSSDDDLTLYAALSFELDRVVFRHEEVGLLRERRATEDARAERAETVLELYYERQRALLALLTEGASPERELLLAHSTARLDAFTNGEFTRMIQSSPP